MSEVNGTAVANRGHQIIINEIESLIRARTAGLHGYQYENARNIYKVGGYPRSLSYTNFKELYDRDPIAGQIVDMVAETTWRSPPEISEPDEPEGTDFTEAVTGLVDRLGVWSTFERADKLARIGRYSVILIGTGATDQALKQPLRNLRGPDDVLFLAPYSEKHAEIDTWVEAGRDPRFGLPETYKIDLSSGVSGFKSGKPGTITVHWSHCIHVAEGLLEDEVYGPGALLRLYNDLHDLQKISTSTAEAFWQRVAGILTAVIGKDDPQAAQATPEELAALDTALKELYHDLRRTFYGQNIELKRLAEGEPDPTGAADLYMTKIAAGAGIPKHMLFGMQTGERASTEDQKAYLGSISERQKNYAEPRILRPFLDRLVKHRALTPGADGYDVVWPTLFQVPEKDVAEANKSRAEAIAKLVPIGGDPTLLYEIDEERNIWPIPRTADEPSPFADLPMGDESGDEPPADTGDPDELDEAA